MLAVAVVVVAAFLSALRADGAGAADGASLHRRSSHHHGGGSGCDGFDPLSPSAATALYTGYPQRGRDVNVGFACQRPFALCSFANCTVIPGASPPMAECGCAIPTPDAGGGGGGGATKSSSGQTDNILDAELWAATVSRCSSTNCTASVNAAPFCGAMAVSRRTGKARMYARNWPRPAAAGCRGKNKAAAARRGGGGPFDLISAYSPTGWPDGTDPTTQGAPAPLGTCPDGGVYTMCFSAGCLRKRAFNGMPLRCLCPIYSTAQPFLLPDGPGFSCEGQSVDGELRYVQSGCQFGCA